MNQATPALRLSPSCQSILFALAAFSLWACGDAIVKYLGSRESIYALGFWSQVIIVTFLLAIGVSGRMGTLRHAVLNPHIKWYALRGVLIFIQFMSGMYCFIHMELAKAYTLIFTAPLLTALFAFVLLKEAAGLAKWLAIALGFGGVLIVLRPGFTALDLPSAMALFNALMFALANIASRHIGGRKGSSPLGLVLVAELVVLIGTIPLYILHFSMPPLMDLLLIAVIGAFATVGYFCLNHAFARAPVSIIAPFHYVQMLWALFFGYVFFAETPDRFVAAGAGLIIVSGLWLIQQERNNADILSEMPIASL